MAHSSEASGAIVRLENLSQRYGDTVALDRLDLSITEGEFFTILGPSGSGKTTTLMLIAGFMDPSAGEIYIAGRPLSRVPPHQRNVGVVFQNYSLFPHMSVAENIAFPLQLRGQSKSAIKQRVQHMLDLVRLPDLARQMPNQLSGGQQQRVALARALAFDPAVLLLDEPLSALDKSLRNQMQVELKHLHLKLGMTVLCVTHDQSEALALSDRVAILNNGRLEQVGAPQELYERPTSRFVATFVGESNMLRGRYAGAVGQLAHVTFSADLAGRAIPRGRLDVAAHCEVFVRPHHVRIGAPAEGLANCYDGVIKTSIYGGDSLKLQIALSDEQTLVASVANDPVLGVDVSPGAAVRVGFSSEHAAVYPATDPKIGD